MLVGGWICAVGTLFAVAPDATSRLADRLRLLPDPEPPTARQKRYARTAGFALVCVGALLAVMVR